MSKMEHVYLRTLKERFGGVLLGGKHIPNGQACVLECAAVARGIKWTDDPTAVNLPDLRPINDSAYWSSDKARTENLASVVIALWDWPEWGAERKASWAHGVALRTVREVLPIALRVVGMEEHAKKCEEASDLQSATSAAADAADAARAAADAAAYAAAYAADVAADAAADAARAAGESVLILACRIWREEAEKSK